ncbi:C2 domain-containing protein [Nymphaea thermarum]|nr:C2 domain-containing protein [Nymphaea thermarum]
MSRIGGLTLELTVVACYNLRDTEWISRQDPYVCIKYANATYSTRICVDGNRNPTFGETFNITLVEGYRKLSVSVWNKNVLMSNYLIGTGKIPLDNALLNGHDDSTWPLQYKSQRFQPKPI